MSPSCSELRELWIERAGLPGTREAELSAHLAACAPCTTFARRADALAAALRDLPRKAAPHSLPGRVVAACNEGFLQDRAARALSALGRVAAPDELEAKVLGDEAQRRHVPSVLDRLVDEELRDPSKALVRRFAGRLPRLSAPAELDARVASALLEGQAAEAALSPRPVRFGRFGRRQIVRAGALGALFAASLATLIVLGVLGTREPEGGAPIVVRVEHVDSAADLSPEARALLAGLTGGLSDFPALEPAFEEEPR